jgi:hypothetical protein
LDDLEQFWVLFTWQQRFESLALGFESSRSPAKLAKRFESSNRILIRGFVSPLLSAGKISLSLGIGPDPNLWPLF